MISGAILSSSYISADTDNTSVVLNSETQFEIFHDQGPGYISNIEPSASESVTLSLRSDKGIITKAYIQYTEDGSAWKSVNMSRKAYDRTGYYEFWQGTVPATDKKYYYRFYSQSSKGNYYYGPNGMSESAPLCENCFLIIPGLSTPDWAKGILWYSILPDAFFNGDILNDKTDSSGDRTIPWGASVQGLREYYGGDISGVISKIDYLKELGVDAVYLNPMWTSNSNAGYGPNNDFETSPNYGNEQDLVKLSEALHENGLKIMLDAVFSYSQMNSIYTNRYGYQPLTGAMQSQSSPYYEMFNFISWPNSYTEKWGGIEIDLGNSLAQSLFWQADNSVLKRYLKAPYNIDGWRLDAVSSYAGTDVTITELGADIRKNVKAVNSDALLIAEDFMQSEIMSGNWDATWNDFFLHSARLWFEGGQYDQSCLRDRLNIISKIPRTIGLCMYNHYDSHDVVRLASDNEAQKHLLRGVYLMLMTYIGSPCIYYGDEVGVENNSDISKSQPRNSFNWNTGEWDYDIYYIHRALSDLRKEYTALKDGVFKIGLTDDENKLTVYGRWDGNGSVVTMLNQCDFAQTVSLNLKQYNIKDGTVVTDYLTGQTYTVRNGFATVNIPAGGSILVTGKAGSYRDRFSLTEELDIVKTGEDSYLVSSDYDINEIKYAATALTPLHGCGYIEADVTSSDGAVLLLRDGLDGKQLTAVMENSKLSVYDTENTVLCSVNLPTSGKVRLGMTAEGLAAAFIGTGGEGGMSYHALAGSVIPFENAKPYAGISAVGGTASLIGVKVGKTGTPLYDSFEENHLGALLSDYSVEPCNYTVANGTLDIEAGNFGALLLSEEKSSDFTFKSALNSVTCGFAGVVSYCDEQNAVALVRDICNGDRLCFGILRNGKIIEIETISGDFSDGVVLQLQKVGTAYSASYIYNGQSYSFTKQISANMSVSRAGIICSAEGSASVDYVSFGNSVSDGSSVNTPITVLENVFPDMDTVTEDFATENYEIIGNSAEWEYALGGIARVSGEGLSQLAVVNKMYSDFKLQCTLLRTSGRGTIGVTMLRSDIDETLGDGYILVLDAEDNLSVKYNQKTLYSSKVSYSADYGLKLNIIRKGDRIYIYSGDENQLLTVISGVTVQKGYCGFYLDNTLGHINNYLVLGDSSLWLEPLSPYTYNFTQEGSGFKVNTAELVYANLKGIAVTSCKASVGINIQPSDAQTVAYAGLLFGAPQNTEPKNGGVLISLETGGILSISKKGTVMQKVSLGADVSSVYITVIADKGCYKVYIDGMNEPSLIWQDTSYDGGVISLVSYNSLSKFSQLQMEDISNIKTDYCAPDYLISRNANVIDAKSAYNETRTTGDIGYYIEPFLDLQEEYTLELDFVVRNPASAASAPIIYFRGNDFIKIGLYINGNGTYLVKQNKAVISDVNAESTYRPIRCVAGTNYHIKIVSSSDTVTVTVNDTLVYDNFNISNCLSGDFSGLPIKPEIICVQGSSGKTVTVLKNITVSGVKKEWVTADQTVYGDSEPVYNQNLSTLYSDSMTVTRLGENVEQSHSYTETVSGKNVTYDFGTKLLDTADYMFSAELCTESRTTSWISPQLVICSGYVDGIFRRISVTVRGDGMFILNEKTFSFSKETTNYDIKTAEGQKRRITVLRKGNKLSVWCDGLPVFDNIDMGEYGALPNTPGLLYIMNNTGSTLPSTCTVSNIQIWNNGIVDDRNIISGDINADGVIDVCDLVLAKRRTVSLNILDKNATAAADAVFDGVLDEADVEKIRSNIQF